MEFETFDNGSKALRDDFVKQIRICDEISSVFAFILLTNRNIVEGLDCFDHTRMKWRQLYGVECWLSSIVLFVRLRIRAEQGW